MVTAKPATGRRGVSPAEKRARAAQLRALRAHLKEADPDGAFGGPWTQKDVADRARMPRENYVTMEAGRASFEGDSLRRVASAYALDPDDLLLYLRRKLSLNEVIARRTPPPGALVAKLDDLAKLKQAVKARPESWSIYTLVRALSTVRPGGKEPEDWAVALDRIESARRQELEGAKGDGDDESPVSGPTSTRPTGRGRRTVSTKPRGAA